MKLFLIRATLTPIELLLRRARRQGFERGGGNPFSIVFTNQQALLPLRIFAPLRERKKI